MLESNNIYISSKLRVIVRVDSYKVLNMSEMATETLENIRLEDIPVDDIDFSDLEEQYKVAEEFSFDQYIVVNGAPVIPSAKVPILKKALTSLFSKAGKVVNMDFPVDEATGKTKGFLFVDVNLLTTLRKSSRVSMVKD
ncbi:PRT1-like protein [Saccharomyces kudriavzevii IFO 1802]|uniref:PRT1-like protein n=1 Tax=Saccharomyces kudriavzevii (strain ATCC MYA-4449 / AS 2.2408 / CBS 8840 / NBRC 1802 / NCYC 2889) TaxID=226230 RepID=J8TWN5_SACK1|nr:PRT1-like protein [Saccharomyces kudriavzevii IFO 1802]